MPLPNVAGRSRLGSPYAIPPRLKYVAFGTLAALLTSLFVAAPVSAAGTVYCVSPTGTPGEGCTNATTFRTLNDASRRNYGPGDTLKLQGGATFRGPLWFDPGESGTASAPITVTSYGSGRALIDSRNTERGLGIDVFNAGGIEISNIDLVGNSAAGSGVQFYNGTANRLSYVRVSNVESSGFRNGISIGGLTDGFANVVVSSANLHDNRDTGVSFYGPAFSGGNYANADVEVRNVVAHHNDGNPNNLSDSTGNGIVLGSVNGGLVTNSEAYENGRLCKTGFGPIGIWAYDSNNVTIQDNESHHNRTGGKADGGGFDLDHNTSNSLIQYNYSHDNEGSGYLMYSNKSNTAFTNNVIRYNISHNDGRKNTYAGIRFGGRIYNSSVHHNTVYVGPVINGAPTAFRSNGVTGGGVTVRNNIFFMGAGTNVVRGTWAPAKLAMQGNDYFGSGGLRFLWGSATYSTLSAWRTATGQEKLNGAPVGFSVNPLLVSPGGQSAASYKLRSGSPMIDKGLNVVSGSRDYFGASVPRGAGRDIGAHEF